MRIATGTLYELGITGILQRQQEVLKTQQQVSSGRRILTPSDDPIGSAAVLGVSQSKAVNEQYQRNIDIAGTVLASEDQALSEATRVLQDIKVLAVNAGNSALNDQDRQALAVEARGLYQEMLGIANRADGDGNYLFAGYQSATPPFSEAAPGSVNYVGDQGQREVRISGSRAVAITDAGSAIFQNVRSGNGTFAAATGIGANTGSGVVDAGRVTDPAKWNAPANSRDFTVAFHVDNSVTPPLTTYDIVDNVNGVSLLTGAAPAAGPHPRTYAPGAALSLKTRAPPDTNATPFDFGAELSVDGAPANGDTFTVKPSTRLDVFSVMNNLINDMASGSGVSAASHAGYRNQLNSAMLGLDHALDTVLTTRAGVGARMKEADNARGVAETLTLQYAQRISGLEDLDYAQALSDLTRQHFQLEAAQKSFKEVSTNSLFNYL